VCGRLAGKACVDRFIVRLHVASAFVERMKGCDFCG
jgi:hypothetical protein